MNKRKVNGEQRRKGFLKQREEKKNGQKRGEETKKTEKKQRERLLQNQLPRPPLPAAASLPVMDNSPVP